ncbi:MAG: HAD-IA family hydrolase [Nocardioides sp.]
MLGLPDHITTCLFDLDGVLTQTAKVHAAAWKAAFDGFLRRRDGDGFAPFDPIRDYDDFVDGKPREDGVRDFLASRRITLPEGSSTDPPGADTIYGLAIRKNVELVARIRRDGVQVYAGSVRYLRAAKTAGLHSVVVSSSANAEMVLQTTGLSELVEGRVDGVTLQTQHLRGKPAPDSFLAGATLANARPDEAVVFEDAVAGVEAGRTGRFGWVVGVDRAGRPDELKQHGADVVVTDLAELLETP